MAKLAQRRRQRFAQAYLKTMDPALAAKAAGLRDPEALLAQDEVQEEIQLQKQQWFQTLGQEDIARRAAELAFGRSNDCVRLAMEKEPDLDRLDLSLLAEIKKNGSGGVEIKLADRMKALEYLAQMLEKEQTPGSEEQLGAAEAFLRSLAPDWQQAAGTEAPQPDSESAPSG